MINHWKALDLEIIDSEYHHDRHPHVYLYHLKPQTYKHVEIIKVSDKPTYDKPLESS